MNIEAWTRLGKALLLNRRPNYVIAFVTGRCNMRCTFCCHAAQTIRETPEMSIDQWARALSGADALLHLTITGGEPFVRKDLLQLISAMVRSSGVPRLSINTNGFYSERIVATVQSLLEAFPGLDLCLSISLDGPKEIHNALRRFPGAFEAARHTVLEAARLRQAHPCFNLRLTSVLQPENEKIMGAFLDETASWPIDFHELALLRDVPLETQLRLADTYARLTLRQLERASRRYVRGLDWRLGRLLRQDILDQVTRGRSSSPCLAGGRMVELLANGSVKGCEMGKMWNVSNIGNVADANARLVDIVESKEAATFRARATRCTCSFECASTCNTVFRPSRWIHLI